ncbi:MAG: hypothetical protein K2X35_12705 [Bryobacteraceae bacterium]|nr:hypothetical protein [Bryobacteraceae bacterium]
MLTEVTVQSWNRYRVTGLSVTACIAGRVLIVPCESKAVEIRLPSAPANTGPDGAYDRDANILCHTWNNDGSQLAFSIMAVDVVVPLGDKLTVPEAAFGRGIHEYCNEEEGAALNRLASYGQQLASYAFDRWVRVLRWQTRIFEIGQPQIDNAESGWGTYLQDASSGRRFHSFRAPIVLNSVRDVSEDEWEMTGRCLKDPAVEPPVWFEFLFDGQHRIANGDLHGGTTCLAIACESILRAVLTQYLRHKDDAIVNLVNQINIGRVIDKWQDLSVVKDWQNDVDMKAIKRLFEVRNRIAHRGIVQDLQPATCEEFMRAARNLIFLADAQL